MTFDDLQPVPRPWLMYWSRRPHARGGIRVSVVYTLPGDELTTPRRARLLVRQELAQWGISGESRAVLELITNELTAHTVEHASSPYLLVFLAYIPRTRTVHVTVTDSGGQTAAAVPSATAVLVGAARERGRLFLMSSLADRCGSYPTRCGMATWAALDLPAYDAPPSASQPTRPVSHETGPGTINTPVPDGELPMDDKHKGPPAPIEPPPPPPAPHPDGSPPPGSGGRGK